MTRARERRPGTGGRRPEQLIGQTTDTIHDTATDRHEPHSGTVVTVLGFALAPAGRRTLWALVVPTCPHCSAAHLHRATGPHDGLRVASCGRPYKIRLTGSRRRRWAR